ncbi:hypothetical protein NLK61_22655 [Pseudomonas fuscovaginae UPB0736]|uniref:DUF6124 family protein n=1 Tax=Pseudomonas asplenii TaxID=53407 RepID=UPI000289073D|nr:hypothetical protein [Pseudomonas fuscovaginae]UUQ64024.1 hypothetical protein NLK61_22655 [Pseudomonas fuscovaginae UPB0736]
MFKITPNPPAEDLSSPAGQRAVDRAFAHYELSSLTKRRSRRETPTAEDTLAQIHEILQSASATAYECADHLQGSTRKLALAVMHLVDLAQVRVDELLDAKQITT